MNLGTILLGITIIALFGDLFFLSFDSRFQKWKKMSETALSIAFLSFIISYCFFIFNIITIDLSYLYVYRFVSSNMDLPLRLASSWSGQEGSFFLWAFFTLSLYIIFRLLFRKMSYIRVYRYSFLIYALNSLALVLLAILNDPFARNFPTPGFGLGLNPTLDTFWNVIHPPVVFLGYSLFSLPFVVSLARVLVGVESFNENPELKYFQRFCMAIAWLVMSVGIALGGYWAYVTLGWGGFWAWDPVETASLIPWLIATIFFHGSPSFRGKGINYSKDLIASLPYLAVIFATFITRSGLLFSVHSFAFSPSISFLIIYLAILFMTLFTSFYMQIKNLKLFLSFEEINNLKSKDLAVYISYLAFIVGTLAILFGLFIPLFFASLPEPYTLSLIVDTRYFNSIIGIFGLFALEASFFGTLIYPRTNNGRLTVMIIGITLGSINAFLGLTVVKIELINSPLSFIYDYLGFLITDSLMANFILPIILVSLICLIIGLIISIKIPISAKPIRIRNYSRMIIHLGILIALFGALYSNNLTQTHTATLSQGDSVILNKSGTLEMKIVNVEYLHDQGELDLSVFSNIQINSNGKSLGVGKLHLGEHKIYDIFTRVLIIRTLLNDYYITAISPNSQNLIGVEDITYQVRIVPLINLLWIGCLILFTTMIPLTIISLKLFKWSYNKSKILNLEKEQISSPAIKPEVS
jgi:cytochrome c-type biogenesis protein CcmF